MPDILRYGRVLGKGLIATFAPSILKAALVEMFREGGVDVRKAVQWVEDDISLWDSLEPERKRQFKHIAGKVGDVDFITTAWAIESLREEYPAIASLFLGWERGYNWLARQIKQIKGEIGSGKAEG